MLFDILLKPDIARDFLLLMSSVMSRRFPSFLQFCVVAAHFCEFSFCFVYLVLVLMPLTLKVAMLNVVLR